MTEDDIPGLRLFLTLSLLAIGGTFIALLFMAVL